MRDASSDGKVICRNRKARHEYEVLETYEAGLVLTGTEIKALRAGRGHLKDAYGRIEGGEVWLYRMHIGPYAPAGRDQHDPERPRKLLLQKGEIHKLAGRVEERGLTLIPLDVHLVRGYAKVTLGLARGRKVHDRREALRRRVAEREVARALRRRAED